MLGELRERGSLLRPVYGPRLEAEQRARGIHALFVAARALHHLDELIDLVLPILLAGFDVILDGLLGVPRVFAIVD